MNQKSPTNTTFNFNDLSDESLIRLKDLLACNVIPFSSTTIWRKVKAGTFPSPLKISTNIVAFRCSAIREWQLDPFNYRATAPPTPALAAKHPRNNNTHII